MKMSITTETPITKKGMKKIQGELDNLIRVEREQIKKSIAEAREHGDLKENAEYHAAKEKQSHIEGRIAQLQHIVAKAEVIDVSQQSSERVVFGATVTLCDVQKDQKIVYQIVGHEEADIKNNLISFKSPLGAALLGKEEGDTVTVNAPKGAIEYEIEEISYR